MNTVKTAHKPAAPGAAAALVVGAGGGIGGALTATLLSQPEYARVHAVSRGAAPSELAGKTGLQWHHCDHSEAAIADVVEALSSAEAPLRRVVICTGILHREDLKPEKALEQISRHALAEVLEANTVVPALWLGALAPLLARDSECVLAVFSARVGSIEDNRLGGWYSYRASKAALNMLLKSAAIELARRAPEAKLLAFHPGTTDTALSRPFQGGVPQDKLFSADFVVKRLLGIMDGATADGELTFLDYDGKAIPW